jgi:hypothetical protein
VLMQTDTGNLCLMPSGYYVFAGHAIEAGPRPNMSGKNESEKASRPSDP